VIGLPKIVRDQIEATYRMMVKTGYSPAAPSDGLGDITISDAERDVNREAAEYAEQWWEQEDDLRFDIGCCNYDTRPATIYAIEAARLMCGGNLFDRLALQLLRLAVEELEARPEPPKL
jgi:hypothetical protein